LTTNQQGKEESNSKCNYPRTQAHLGKPGKGAQPNSRIIPLEVEWGQKTYSMHAQQKKKTRNIFI